jgi:transposase
MNQYNKTVVGLDVHKETVVTGVLPAWSERVTEAATLENRPVNIEKLVKRLAETGPVEFVYEAGPCGFEIQRQIEGLGHRCVLVAPGLIPKRAADRVKTDRRDAEKLARLWRAGELTAIHVPTREDESARDLVRAREDVLGDRLRARHRLGKFLLRQGRVYRECQSWSQAHRAWLRTQRFEWPALQQTFDSYLRTVEEAEARLATMDQQVEDLAQKEPYRTPVRALRCLKGIDTLSALTLAAEVQDFRRFEKAVGFMKYTGLVGSVYQSADKIRRGGIIKAGNAHIRRVLVEAAWSYRHRNITSQILTERRRGCSVETIRIARKAQDRLHRLFGRMAHRSKPYPIIVTAVARELAGFVWAIGRQAAPTV